MEIKTMQLLVADEDHRHPETSGFTRGHKVTRRNWSWMIFPSLPTSSFKFILKTGTIGKQAESTRCAVLIEAYCVLWPCIASRRRYISTTRGGHKSPSLVQRAGTISEYDIYVLFALSLSSLFPLYNIPGRCIQGQDNGDDGIKHNIIIVATG